VRSRTIATRREGLEPPTAGLEIPGTLDVSPCAAGDYDQEAGSMAAGMAAQATSDAAARLALVTARWHTLPDHVQQTIASIIRATPSER